MITTEKAQYEFDRFFYCPKEKARGLKAAAEGKKRREYLDKRRRTVSNGQPTEER